MADTTREMPEAITASTQAAVYGAIALGAAGARRWLGENGSAQVRLGRAVGLLLIGVAVWAAWEGWQRV